MGLRKIPGQRWIEVKNRIDVFFAEYIQCWRSCGCKCMMKIVFNSKYRLQQNLIHWQKQRWGSFSLLSSFPRLTVRLYPEVMLASSSGEDIVVPLTRLCCSLSLVVAQSLKTQVSYFLDEHSMLYSANTRLQSTEQV
ncbi:hypothetical protein LWI29_033868 [Acer saccharum]|uniref:Uncharacterized protein n=1 Tax=Acer saccharum TaxID=4024 RepID=A0AA39RZR6_ACESA|nr:hypothetical protein LWI29_033868 [Acer saccharum]